MPAVVHSRLTAKSQTTLPKEVRAALRLAPGDTVAYEIRRGRVVLSKAGPLDRSYLRALQTTLDEWTSKDDAVFDDL